MQYRGKLIFLLIALAAGAGTSMGQDFSLLGNTNLEFDANAGTSPASQTVGLTNNTGNPISINLSTSTQSGGGWLHASISPNPVQANGSATITVSVSSSLLPPDTYNGRVKVSDSSGNSEIDVTLVVSGVSISVNSASSITLREGSTGSFKVKILGGPASVQISSNQSWLSPDGSASAPGSFNVGVDATQLSIGGHTGTITLQCVGGSPCVPVSVFVAVTVTPKTFLHATVQSLSFQAYANRPDPPPQTLALTSSDGSELPFTLSPPSAAWLSVTTDKSVASSSPAVLTVSVAAARLTSGMNSGTFTATDENNQTLEISVTATSSAFTIDVTPSPTPAVSVPSGQMAPVTLQVGTADGQPETVAIAAQTADNGAWLKAPASVNAPLQFSITVDASQLTPNSYSGTLTFSCSDGNCTAVKVSINVTVTAGTIAPKISAVVGAGLSVPPVNSLSANGLFTLFGSGFAAPSLTRHLTMADTQAANNALPTNLGGTCVRGNGADWALIYVSAVQINAVANPLATSGTVAVTVARNCGQPNETVSAALNVPVAAETPEFLFAATNPNGKNEIIAIEHATGANVGPPGLLQGDVQAKAGDILTSYGVGWGTTNPAAVVGSLAAQAANITGNYTFTVGGKSAKVLYAGLAPSFAGLYQLNFVVPSGLSSGNQPVVLTINKVSTPSGAFLAVK